jgi:Fe-S cluster biosynthesis and repair protein YggX
MIGVVAACIGLVFGFVVFCRMLKSEARKYYQENREPGEPGPDVYYCMSKYWQEFFHRVIY